MKNVVVFFMVVTFLVRQASFSDREEVEREELGERFKYALTHPVMVGHMRILQAIKDTSVQSFDTLNKSMNGMRKTQVVRTSGLTLDSLQDMPEDLRRPLEEALKVKGVDIDITGDRAVDVAVAKVSKKAPEIAYRVKEKLFTIDGITLRKTHDGRLEIRVPITVQRHFLRKELSLLKEVRNKLIRGDPDASRKILAKVIAESTRYEPCGFFLDRSSQRTVTRAVDAQVAIDLKELIDSVSSQLAGHGQAMERAMEYIGIPKREAVRIAKETMLAGREAVIEKEVPEMIKEVTAEAPLTAKPVSPVGTLSPAGMPVFVSEPVEGLTTANIEQMSVLAEFALDKVTEEEKAAFTMKINSEKPDLVEKVETVALLLKRVGLLKTDIGIVIDARKGAFDLEMVVGVVNGVNGRGTGLPARPFVLVDSQGTYSELIIMGVPAGAIILVEGGRNVTEVVKAHLERYSIDIAPPQMSFTLAAEARNTKSMRECYADFAPKRDLCNFIIADSGNFINNQPSNILCANVMLIMMRLANTEKPPVMAIGEEGIERVKDLEDLSPELNIVRIKSEKIEETIKSFISAFTPSQ
jgi:hypothetical protein